MVVALCARTRTPGLATIETHDISNYYVLGQQSGTTKHTSSDNSGAPTSKTRWTHACWSWALDRTTTANSRLLPPPSQHRHTLPRSSDEQHNPSLRQSSHDNTRHQSRDTD